MSILLDPEKGVNPFLTYCTRCGGDGPDLILVGRKQYKDVCDNCGGVYLGGRDRKVGDRPYQGGQCQFCKEYTSFTRSKIEEGEKLPGGLCKNCEDEIEEHKKVVAAGGIYFKCSECNAQGVIKANEFTAIVRAQHGLENGEPCGIEFNHTDTPKCPNAEG